MPVSMDAATDKNGSCHAVAMSVSSKANHPPNPRNVSDPTASSGAVAKAELAHLARLAALAYYAFASMGAQYFVKVCPRRVRALCAGRGGDV